MKLNINKESNAAAKDINLLYLSVFWIVELSKFLNIIEFTKLVIYKINLKKQGHEKSVKRCNNFIPIFIIIKWVLISILLSYGIYSQLIIGVVWYLIFVNIHTYFLHHLWDCNFDYPIQKFRRRFLNLFQAVCFSNFAFTYLYTFAYPREFELIEGSVYKQYYSELRYSFANSISNTNYNFFNINKLSEWGANITLLQLVLSFTFLTILLASSLTPPNKEIKQETTSNNN